MQKLMILPEEASFGERADKYLAAQFPQYSRSFLQKLFKEEQIKIQETPIKASYRVDAEEISLTIPDAQTPDIVPENIPLDILYEDDSLLIVNKPKGMVVHPAHGHYNGTLVNALMYHCKDSLSGINGVLRPGIVHRIDMDIIKHRNDKEAQSHKQKVEIFIYLTYLLPVYIKPIDK